VQINATSGVYVSYVVEQRIDDADYLVVQAGCSCSWLPPAVAATRDGLVYANDPSGYNFGVGRKNLTNGFNAITKVIMSSNLQFYVAANGVETSDQADQILVCERPVGAPAKPTITFPTKACGECRKCGAFFVPFY
jgi:hypothetical protein